MIDAGPYHKLNSPQNETIALIKFSMSRLRTISALVQIKPGGLRVRE